MNRDKKYNTKQKKNGNTTAVYLKHLGCFE